MAIALTDNGDNSGSGADTIDLTGIAPSGSNRLLCVGVAISDASVSTIDSVTQGATSLTELNNQTFGTYYRMGVWYLANPATSGTITADFGASQNEIYIAAMSFSGVDQTTPIDTGTDAFTNSGSMPTTNTITSETGDLVAAFCYGAISSGLAADPSGTLHDDQYGIGGYTGGGTATVTGSASTELGFDGTANEHGVMTWNINQASGGTTQAIGQATETNTALGLTAEKTTSIGLATETDAPLGLTPERTHEIGLATEADSALVMSHSRGATIGLATSPESALAVGAAKALAIGLTTEADSALPVTTGGTVVAIGLAEETDEALAASVLKTLAIGLATEADAALGLTPLKVYLIGLTTEADEALAMSYSRGAVIGIATSAESALNLSHARALAIGLALETDSALAVSLASGDEIIVPFTEWEVTAFGPRFVEFGIEVLEVGADPGVTGLPLSPPPHADPWLRRLYEILREELGRKEPALLGYRYDQSKVYIRFRAAIGTPWVQVHIQSADGVGGGTGGPAYDPATSVVSTEVDCRENRLQEVEVPILGTGRYIAFLVPVLYDGEGTKILFDGQSGRPDHIAFFDMGT